MYLGAPFSPSWKSQGGAFRLRGRPVVISELRSGIHILGRHFMFRVLGWETRSAAFFSGVESARLWLRNSGAVFASWGAVFTWFRAQRAAFLILTLARKPCFATFAGVGGGGWCDPPWRFQTKRRRASRKRLADCSRRVLAIGGIIFGPWSIFDPVMAGQRSNFRKFHDFST